MIDWNSDKTRVELREIKTTLEMYGHDCKVVRWALAYRFWRNHIWWDVRRRFLSYLQKAPPKDNRLHVYFHMRGGIGDCAANRIALVKLRELLPDAVFYFFTDAPGAATALFPQDEKHVFLEGKIPLWYRYDLAFEICLSFKTVHADWKRIEQIAPHLIPVLKKGLERQKQLDFLVGDNYLMDEVLGRFLAAHHEPQLLGQSYLSGLDYPSDTTGLLPPELLNPAVLEKYGLTGKKYITVHNGVNTEIRLNGRLPLKCWETEKWQEFIRLFKQEYPSVLVVQVGGKNSQKLEGVDVDLIGKTTLPQLPALLNGSLLHIDGESGLAQLTRWLNTKAVVFFSLTSKDCFGLSKNRNLSEEVCRPCMWLSGPDWYFNCALGYPRCKNLEQITPVRVMNAVREELKTFR